MKALAETANKAATETIRIMELYHELGSLQKVKMRAKGEGRGREKKIVVGGRRRGAEAVVLLAHVESNGSCSTETYVDPT